VVLFYLDGISEPHALMSSILKHLRATGKTSRSTWLGLRRVDLLADCAARLQDVKEARHRVLREFTATSTAQASFGNRVSGVTQITQLAADDSPGLLQQ
jgi:hypothetical protein